MKKWREKKMKKKAVARCKGPEGGGPEGQRARGQGPGGQGAEAKNLVRYVTDVGSPYCSSVVNGRKMTKYWMKRRNDVKKRRTTVHYVGNRKRLRK